MRLRLPGRSTRRQPGAAASGERPAAARPGSRSRASRPHRRPRDGRGAEDAGGDPQAGDRLAPSSCSSSPPSSSSSTSSGRLWSILLPIVLGLLIATVLWPPTRFLRNHRWPPALAASTVLLAFLAAFGGIIAAIAPSVADQVTELADQATAGSAGRPGVAAGPAVQPRRGPDRRGRRLGHQLDPGQRAEHRRLRPDRRLRGRQQPDQPDPRARAGLLLPQGRARAGCRGCPRRPARGPPATWRRCRYKTWSTLSEFIRQQALVGFIDAFFIGLGLWILGVPLVLPLAVLTFFGGFIPIIGAFVAGAFAVLIALVERGLHDRADRAGHRHPRAADRGQRPAADHPGPRVQPARRRRHPRRHRGQQPGRHHRRLPQRADRRAHRRHLPVRPRRAGRPLPGGRRRRHAGPDRAATTPAPRSCTSRSARRPTGRRPRRTATRRTDARSGGPWECGGPRRGCTGQQSDRSPSEPRRRSDRGPATGGARRAAPRGRALPRPRGGRRRPGRARAAWCWCTTWPATSTPRTPARWPAPTCWPACRTR